MEIYYGERVKIKMIPQQIRKIIETALNEDIGTGDITTTAIVSRELKGKAKAVAKDNFVVAGIDVFRNVFLFLDDTTKFNSHVHDGEAVKKGDVIAEVSGNLFYILQAERVALNLFQRMCGIATLTRKYVDAVKRTKARIIDTRKTMPGLRLLDKMAVSIGGGFNHRMGLYDGVLIKDNHITAAGSIAAAVEAQRRHLPHTLKIEVETKNLPEVKEALNCGVDIILLDNMSPKEMKKAVELIRSRALTEASGNVTLDKVAAIAAAGVDLISIGELTHSVRTADISLLIK